MPSHRVKQYRRRRGGGRRRSGWLACSEVVVVVVVRWLPWWQQRWWGIASEALKCEARANKSGRQWKHRDTHRFLYVLKSIKEDRKPDIVCIYTWRLHFSSLSTRWNNNHPIRVFFVHFALLIFFSSHVVLPRALLEFTFSPKTNVFILIYDRFMFNMFTKVRFSYAVQFKCA